MTKYILFKIEYMFYIEMVLDTKFSIRMSMGRVLSIVSLLYNNRTIEQQDISNIFIPFSFYVFIISKWSPTPNFVFVCQWEGYFLFFIVI